jgi:ribosome maturation factor RimP
MENFWSGTIKEKENFLIELVKPVLEELGLELLEIKCGQMRKGIRIQVIVDRVGGVTLKECTVACKKLNYLLDRGDETTHEISMEVSSPGLDRPLETTDDFRRNINRYIKVFFTNEKGLKKEISGYLRNYYEDSILLEHQENDVLKIIRNTIIMAKGDVDFEKK